MENYEILLLNFIFLKFLKIKLINDHDKFQTVQENKVKTKATILSAYCTPSGNHG